MGCISYSRWWPARAGPLAPKLGIVCTPFHYACGSFRAISMYGFRVPAGGKGWGPLPRPQRCDSGHHDLQQSASFADDSGRAAHGDPRSKIAFLGSITALVLVVNYPNFGYFLAACLIIWVHMKCWSSRNPRCAKSQHRLHML
jgi:hypothetical protein